jgi:carbon monoxide dehydrogenase subunit G
MGFMSTTVSRTIRTSTSLQKCWDFLSDFSNTEQWDPGTVSCHKTSPGDNGVGAEYENVSEFKGRKTTLQYRVTTFEPGRHLVLEGENDTVKSIDDMTFSGDENGTEVVYSAHFTFKGAAKLAEPFLKKPLNQLADEAEAGMQKALDVL